MDKFVALNAFVAVAELGGFSKAARRMGVATSSLTRLVDALEHQLGTSLLTRSTRAVTLTDSGVAYLEQVGPLLQELALADEAISDRAAEAAGPLRVTVPMSFGRLFLGPQVANFLKQNPRVSLDMELSDTIIDLSSDRIDVAVRIGAPANQSGLIVRKLADHHRYVVASADYLAAQGTPETPAQLALHECLRFSYRPGPQRWSFLQKRQRQQVEITGRFSANSSDMLREATLGGQGIALLPDWLVGRDVQTGGLVRLFDDWDVNPVSDPVSIYAAYLPNRRHSRKVHAFLDFLEACASCKGVW